MIYLLLSLITFTAFAQNNFERVNAEKIVVSSTSQASMPCPAMTQTQRDATSPVNGECVYNTTSGKLNTYNGSLWIEVGSGSGGISDWQTATGYLVGDLVIESNRFYRALVAHTSGTFATDLAAAKWLLTPSVTKADVGLGNVDNTSDATKNSAAVSLTNKTIDADLNTITNIENADIKSGAAIDASKLADGSVSNTEFQFIGSLTSDAQAQINTKVAGPASSVDGEIALYDSTTGKLIKRASGTGIVKSTSGVASFISGTTDQVLSGNYTFVNPKVNIGTDTQTATLYEEIDLPNNQRTAVSATKVRLETGDKNILINPSFEHGSTVFGWTDVGTETISVDNNIYHDGVAAAKFSPASESIDLSQSSALYATNFADGVQCLASVRIKSGLTAGTLSVCAVQAGTVSTTYCVTVNNDDKWGLYKVPFLCGGTSNGISIAGSSLTGTVYVDDAYVGAPDLIQDSTIVGPWRTFTPTGAWSTNTSYTGRYRQVGQNIEVQVSVATSGAPTAASLSINLPSGFTIDTTKMSGTPSANATGIFGVGVATDAGTNSYPVMALYNSTTSVILGAYNAAAAASASRTTVNQTVPFTFGSSDTIDITFTVPTVELNGNISTFTAQCGANCVDTFTAFISSTGVVSAENSNFINGNCTNSPTGFYDCTFNSGIFTVAPNCVADVQSQPASAASIICSAQSTTTSTTQVNCLQGSTDIDRQFVLTCSKQGADFTATRLIQGTFKNMLKYGGFNKPRTVVAGYGGSSTPTVCSTGTCTELFDPDGVFTAPAYGGSTGTYTNFTIANGTFAANSIVICDVPAAFDAATGGARKGVVYWETGDQTVYATASGGYVSNVFTSNMAGTAQNTWFTISCTGEAAQ